MRAFGSREEALWLARGTVCRSREGRSYVTAPESQGSCYLLLCSHNSAADLMHGSSHWIRRVSACLHRSDENQRGRDLFRVALKYFLAAPGINSRLHGLVYQGAGSAPVCRDV